MKRGCADCSRYALIIINTTFLIFGLLLLMLGIWVIAVPATKHVINISSTDTTSEQIWKGCLLVIGTGGIIILISLIACCGAINSNSCILLAMSIILSVILVVEIALIALGFLFANEIEQGIISELTISLHYYSGDNSTDPISMGWKEVQIKFACCGITTSEGYTNHTNIFIYNETGSQWYRDIGMSLGQEWPDSCCVQNSYGQVNDTVACHNLVIADNKDLRQVGCYDKVLRFLQVHMGLISVICIILFTIQLVSIILSCKLYRVFKDPRFRTF